MSLLEELTEEMEDLQYKDEIDSDLEIDETRIHLELLSQPKVYFKWALRSARAYRYLQKTKLQTKTKMAELMKRAKDDYIKKNGKEMPVTYSADKWELPLQKEYFVQQSLLAEAEETAEIIAAVKDSIKQKKDMLTTFAYMIKEEMESNASKREESDEE